MKTNGPKDKKIPVGYWKNGREKIKENYKPRATIEDAESQKENSPFRKRRTPIPTEKPECPEGCAVVPLTRGKWSIIDIDDLERVSKFNWLLHQGGYAMTSIGGRLNKANLWMARFIMRAPKSHEVDHINGDRLDNRKCNLRLVDPSAQCQNRGLFKNNLLQVKGVRRMHKGYQARLQVNGKAIHIGTFKTIELAAQAYRDAAIKYHGEFARL